MNNYLNIEKLLANKAKYYSVTISPKGDYFEATFFHRLKLRKDGVGKRETKKFKYVVGSDLLPQISNGTVKHLGYKRYYHLMEDGFYINLYFAD